MYCTFLRKRHNRGEIVFYCVLNKEYINTYVVCKSCLKRKYERNKGIRKVSKKRIFVTSETYNKVYERDKGRCRLCGTSQGLELHHIRGRGKDLTNNIENCIMLCNNCHHNVVHKNQKKFRPILLKLVKGEIDGTKNNYMF